MKKEQTQELYHDIFGSVLDRIDLTPYLMRNSFDYKTSLERATAMMANRGFYVVNGVLGEGEFERARAYVSQSIDFITRILLPTVKTQIEALLKLPAPESLLPEQKRLFTEQKSHYSKTIDEIHGLEKLLVKSPLSSLILEDPRHLFMLVSAKKFPDLFNGHPLVKKIPSRWRFAACTVLKVCHLIKSIEEDSQDMYDYACLGLFFQTHGISLSGLYDFPWMNPPVIPEDENARMAFVKVAAFFHKFYASIVTGKDGSLVFNSGDGVQVDLVEVKARLKSPESMFIKLGKDISGEIFNIRDILAVTFLIKNRDDSLMLFHALQKQGVILQENTVSTSITQTLYDNPEEMYNAVEVLMESLARREGSPRTKFSRKEILANARSFLKALNANIDDNPHSSRFHRKIQFKINCSVPVQHYKDSYRVIISDKKGAGKEEEKNRSESIQFVTRQQTLPVELRISDIRSWELSEWVGDAHHDAYRCRQLLVLLNRLCAPLFHFPDEAITQLRADQDLMFR